MQLSVNGETEALMEAAAQPVVIGSCGTGLGPHLVTSEAVSMPCGHGFYQLQLAFAKSRQGQIRGYSLS